MESVKMKTTRSFLSGLFFLVLVSFVVFFVLSILSKPSQEEQLDSSAVPQPIDLVAIGDSLTEGIGDSLESGGYVPRVAELLEDNESVSQVTTVNFGIAGNTSGQILQRMENDPEIEKAVTEAEMVVFTLGGNDVIKTFKNELLNVQLESFEEPLVTYKENLSQILEQTQEWNPETAIYVFGIYNPYEIYFSEIEEMQLIMEEWNQSTATLAASFPHTHFIPIDTAFTSSRVLSSDTSGTENASVNEAYQNPYLYEEDLFHPNDEGYRKMAAILYNEIKKGQPFWLNE